MKVVSAHQEVAGHACLTHHVHRLHRPTLGITAIVRLLAIMFAMSQAASSSECYHLLKLLLVGDSGLDPSEYVRPRDFALENQVSGKRICSTDLQMIPMRERSTNALLNPPCFHVVTLCGLISEFRINTIGIDLRIGSIERGGKTIKCGQGSGNAIAAS